MTEALDVSAPSEAGPSWDRQSWDMVLRGDPNGWMRRQGRLIEADELADAFEGTVERRGQRGAPETIDVYTHFSYCRSTCSFCMYWHQVPGRLQQYDEYADHLVRLCERIGSRTGGVEVSNAYFGGGTPSAMPLEGLTRFLDAFGRTFRVGFDFTTEAHPNTLDDAKMTALLQAGVNRISMGLQSLDPVVLQQITRHNRPLREVAQLVRSAQAGGALVNLDLCLGLPRQTLASLQRDVRDLVGMGPDGLTVYRYHPVPSLPVPAPEGMNYDALFDDAIRAEIEEAAYDLHCEARRSTAKLSSRDPHSRRRAVDIASGARGGRGGRPRGCHGYAQFSWEPSSILGLGPGAYSHVYGRFWVREVTRLQDLGGGGDPVYWGARITLEDEIRIAVLQNFDRSKVVPVSELERFSGIDVEELLGDLLRELEADGLITWLPERTHSRGRLLHAFEFSPDVGAAARREIAERIAPPMASPPPLSVEQRARVQPQLVVDPERGEQGPPPMVQPWRDLLGVPGVGRRFLGARVEVVDERSVHFTCEVAGGTPLRVFVYSADEEKAFRRSGRFALSYGSRPGLPLTEREQRFVEALAARTLELDPKN